MLNNQKPYYQYMQRTEHLVFLKELDPFIRANGRPRRVGLFKCSCGKETAKRLESVKSGKVKSCGCMKGKMISKAKIIHGKCNTDLYYVWHNMKVRCYNKNNYHYKWYGSRGISVCDDWRQDFQSFYKWAIAANWKKGLTIDRIDNNGNYEPSNCRFVTQKENVNNAREITKANTSGHRNIKKIKEKYRVVVKRIHLGMYSNLEEAISARDKYKIKEFS